MLNGEIKVNNEVIGVWEAKRLDAITSRVCTYRCMVRMYTNSHSPGVYRFNITHRTVEGALSLASKVLSQAAPMLRGTGNEAH